jgi:hypothetical protein
MTFAWLILVLAAYNPQIVPADFAAKADNPFYPLVPGTTLTYLEKSGGLTITNVVTITRDTKTILGVTCVVVQDTVFIKGRRAEETYDCFAQHKDGAIWHFGAAAKETSPGGRVSTAGSWETGVKGAQPGIAMPARPTPGPPGRRHYARNVAEDMQQIVATNETVTVPAGTFTGCIKTKEWSMLEAGTELKWYAPGVGLVKEIATAGDSIVLISITRE